MGANFGNVIGDEFRMVVHYSLVQRTLLKQRSQQKTSRLTEQGAATLARL